MSILDYKKKIVFIHTSPFMGKTDLLIFVHLGPWNLGRGDWIPADLEEGRTYRREEVLRRGEGFGDLGLGFRVWNLGCGRNVGAADAFSHS